MRFTYGDVFWRVTLLGVLAQSLSPALASANNQAFTNSLGMSMVRIAPGTFLMGVDGGDEDEQPAHEVVLSRPFWMAAAEVNNSQYEQFDPAHKKLRGERGLSKEDDEAVIFVSWDEATAFCKWLSKREGKPYRLPTEAEWEFACRAGTTAAYHTGKELPAEYRKQQSFSWDPKPVGLHVGRTPPNAWGLHDMHGNVEEWCFDTYGPYIVKTQPDPVGYAAGDFKVARGGSHNTELVHLRSANRMGTLPGDKHWLIGFRVVMGELSTTPPLRNGSPKPWQNNVAQTRFEWPGTATEPLFTGPVPFVRPPVTGSREPFYPHNHCPAVTWCDNGDLLAIWFSTRNERGREMTILASRRRAGSVAWEPSSEFFKAPDRNMTGSSLFNDGKGRLYHLNGLEAGDGWGNLALVVRTSEDNGASWSAPRFANPNHQRRNQVIAGISMTRDGVLIQPCDADWSGNGGTAIHLSNDLGLTWTDPGADTPAPRFVDGGQGSTIAGIHAGVVSLRDGRLLAFGRGDDIGGKMPKSISTDAGKTWSYSASPWSTIGSGQRLVLMRLREGPLLFVSFTDNSRDLKAPRGIRFQDGAGTVFTGYGMFATLSFDEGETWGSPRLMTSGGPARKFDGGAWTRDFVMDATHGEPRGYLVATQTPDGVIHLLSSALHYQFNLAWLKEPANRHRVFASDAAEPATSAIERSGEYRFDKTISREVLQNYLSRAITMEGLLNGRGDLADNIRMLKGIGAKFIGRSLCLWGGEAAVLSNLARAKQQSPRIHAADPDMVLQACIFEIVTTQVDQVPIPHWAFTDLSLQVEERNFRYADMLYPDGRFKDHWRHGQSVPDVSRPETRLWFYFLGASFIDAGCEAIHFGQTELMNGNDRELKHYSQVLALIRSYAARHARRHMVLCDSHVPSGGLVRDGQLLMDFHSFPLRIMETADRPQEAILKLGFSDGIYGRSKGGTTFSGWECEHLPYLVEIDNWGVSKTPGQAKSGGIWIWGWDEISWFANQGTEYRSNWLQYAWDWVRRTDPNGYLQMPGSRTLAGPVGRKRWYYANNPSAAVPDGFGDEAAVRAVWETDTSRRASTPHPAR